MAAHDKNLAAATEPAGRNAGPVPRLHAALLRYRGWLFAGLALLYLAGFSGQWRMGEDSALYLVLGRSLAEGEGYRFAGEWHRLGYPGLPMLLAPLWWVFGEATPAAATWLMAGIAALTLSLAYRLARLHAGGATAVALVVLLGVSENFFRYAFQVRNDMPFLLGILGVLAGYEGLRVGRDRGGPRGLNWALLAGGLVWATFMRPVMVTLHLAVLAAAVWGVVMGPRRSLHAALMATSVATLALFLASDPRREVVPPQATPVRSASVGEATAATPPRASGHYEAGLSQKLEDLPATLWRGVSEYWTALTWDGVIAETVLGIELGGGVPNAAFAGAVLLGGVALAWRRRLWGLLVAAVLVQSLFFRPFDRALLPMQPMLLLACWWGVTHAARRLPADWARIGLITLGGLLIGPNLGLCVAEIIELRTPDRLAVQDGGKFAAVPGMAQAVRRHVPPDATVVAAEARILELLTRRTTLMPETALERWGLAPHHHGTLAPPPEAPRPDHLWAVLRIPATRVERDLLAADAWSVVEEVTRDRRGVADDVKPDADVDEADRGWRLVRLEASR